MIPEEIRIWLMGSTYNTGKTNTNLKRNGFKIKLNTISWQIFKIKLLEKYNLTIKIVLFAKTQLNKAKGTTVLINDATL